MTKHDWFDRGALSGVLHLILGAIFGSVTFAVITILFVDSKVFWRLIIFGAITCGVSAAIWRGRFWAFVANNPLVTAYRRMFGGGF